MELWSTLVNPGSMPTGNERPLACQTTSCARLAGLYPLSNRTSIPMSDHTQQNRHAPTADPSALIDSLLREPSVRSSTVAERLTAMREDAPVASATASERNDFLLQLSKVLFLNRLQREMSRLAIPFPVYNHLEDISANEPLPWAPPVEERPVVEGRSWRLLGRDIGIPIGIPASELTVNAEWIAYHAQNGFNVLTYKTVRTRYRDALGSPNWIFLSKPSDPIATPPPVSVNAEGDLDTWPVDPDRFSTANSFGVPSRDPELWIPDVKAALTRLAPDQLLILSVMGTFEEERGDALVADFIEAAVLGVSTGVQIIELNLSCPNGIVDGSPLPPVCSDPGMVQRIVEGVRDHLDPTVSIIVKFGYLERAKLRKTLEPIAAIVDAVSGINTWQAAVTLPGRPSVSAFPGRTNAGISGYVLQTLALDFVGSASAIRQELGASYDIIGMGGVMTPVDARRLYEAGASAVQSASGAFFNHHLAEQLVVELGASFPRHEPADLVNLDLVREEVLTQLKGRQKVTVAQLAARSSFGPSVVRSVVGRLSEAGRIRKVQVGGGLTDLYSLH